MTQINLPTYEQQQAIKQDTTNILTQLSETGSKLDAAAKPTTLLSVKDGSYSYRYSSPSTMLQLFASNSDTANLMGHVLVYPKNIDNGNPINPFTQTECVDVKLSEKRYSSQVVSCRIYKDGIMVLVGKGTDDNSSSNPVYYYSFYVYKVRGFNDKGLPLYELLGSQTNVTGFTNSYPAFSFFFRKGDKVAFLFGERQYNDRYNVDSLSNIRMLQFDLTTKQMTIGRVSLSGIAGLNTSSTFYFPTPTNGTLNDIDYGYLMYYSEARSNYGKIKYMAEFNPDTTSITFTGKWENYSTATDTYIKPTDVTPHVVTQVKYNQGLSKFTYSTILDKQRTYEYNKYSSLGDTTIPTTYEGMSEKVKPAMLDGVAYAYFELTNGLAIYKLNSALDKYEYMGTLSTAMFSNANYEYISYGLHHFGLVVLFGRKVGSYTYYDSHYADYTNELRELLGIGG